MFKRKFAVAAVIALSLTGGIPFVQAEASGGSIPMETAAASTIESPHFGESASARPVQIREAPGSEWTASAQAMHPNPQDLAGGKGFFVFCGSMAVSFVLMLGVFGLTILRRQRRNR